MLTSAGNRAAPLSSMFTLLPVTHHATPFSSRIEPGQPSLRGFLARHAFTSEKRRVILCANRGYDPANPMIERQVLAAIHVADFRRGSCLNHDAVRERVHDNLFAKELGQFGDAAQLLPCSGVRNVSQLTHLIPLGMANSVTAGFDRSMPG